MAIIPKDRREVLASDLLIQLLDEVDDSGNPINVERFSFSEELSQSRIDRLGITFDELTQLLDFCLARKYLKHTVLGGGKYYQLGLTEQGQGRAISEDRARSGKQPVNGGDKSSIHIEKLSTTGVTQIGSDNISENSGQLTTGSNSDSKTRGDNNQGTSSRILAHPLLVGIVVAILSAVLAFVLRE